VVKLTDGYGEDQRQYSQKRHESPMITNSIGSLLLLLLFFVVVVVVVIVLKRRLAKEVTLL